MRSSLLYSLMALMLTWAQAALAQSTLPRQVWIQLETRLNLEASLDSIEIYARDLDNVNGFEINGGWFGVAIGPYDPEQADAALQKFPIRRLWRLNPPQTLIGPQTRPPKPRRPPKSPQQNSQSARPSS